MKKGLRARIIGHGAYVPERIFTNKEFESIIETSDEWIVTRTGISERRIAAVDEFTSDMGAKAAKNALESSGFLAKDIDCIVVATMSPDYISNCTAALIQAKIGAENAAALDIQAACSGFIYALSTAKAYIESGMYRNVLVVASEKMSTYIDYTDRTTCVLFGDGAAAVIVSNEGSGLAIDNISLGADGTLADLILIPAGGVRNPSTVNTVASRMHCFRMEGKEVFKHAVRRMSIAAKKCLSDMELTDQDISWIVPHQANIRIMEAIAKGFDIPEERMYKTVHKYGNTSASSIPLALEELVRTHPIEKNEHLLLVAFGAGLTWGAAVLTQI
jgi:3-oxoacyl-[acyl-carrier-protein] synthase-3